MTQRSSLSGKSFVMRFAYNTRWTTLVRVFQRLAKPAGDVAYTAEQMGHEDPTFTLRGYMDAVKRRQRLSGAELEQFNRAIEWAQWARLGTSAQSELTDSPQWSPSEERKAPR